MKVVNPNVRIKTISLIPRFKDVENFDLLLINETTKEETTFFIDNYSYIDGILLFGFDFRFIFAIVGILERRTQ